MCARCDDLEEEVAYLKSELGLRDVAERVHSLSRGLSVAPGVASMLLRLHDANGRLVTHAQLHEAIPVVWGGGDRSEHITRVYVSHARRSLGRKGIETVWGEGYRLSTEGRARVSTALMAEAS